VSYRSLGGIPAGAAAAANQTASSLATTAFGPGAPEGQLATSIFAASLTGNGAQVQAALTAGAATIGTMGAAAACAATGVGAVAAPLCGYVGGVVVGKLAGLLFGGGGPSCGEQRRAAVEATKARLMPACGGDRVCFRTVIDASEAYAERSLPVCAVMDGWSMKPAMLRELDALHLSRANASPTLLVPAGFFDPKWERAAKARLSSEAGAAILQAKIRRWDRDAKAAKAVADAEYDQLVTACPKRLVKSNGITPCQRKAADAATTIAARSYLFAITDGAKPILATELEAVRRQFRAEVAQDEAVATLAAAQTKAAQAADQARRAALSTAIEQNATTTHQRTMMGLGLLAVAAVGGAYLWSRRR
jgi:hypothetical protein